MRGIARDFRVLRLLGTALGFVLFGLFGIVLGTLVFPVFHLLPLGQARRRALARRVVHRCFRSFVRIMSGLGALSYQFDGIERLGRPGQLIVANHPSLIDVVFLIGFTPGAGCVVKHELFRNPFTAGVARMSGYVPNAPTIEMVEAASAALENGDCLIMFPEGTRSRPGEAMEFHRGAAAVAVRAASTVTPVYVRVAPPTLRKGEPWYRIPVARPHFELVVGEDINVLRYRATGPLPRAARAFNAYLAEHFSLQLQGSPGVVDGHDGHAKSIRDSATGIQGSRRWNEDAGGDSATGP